MCIFIHIYICSNINILEDILVCIYVCVYIDYICIYIYIYLSFDRNLAT